MSALLPLLSTRSSLSETVPCGASSGFLVAVQGFTWLLRDSFTWLWEGTWTVPSLSCHTLQGIFLSPHHFTYLSILPKEKVPDVQLLGQTTCVFYILTAIGGSCSVKLHPLACPFPHSCTLAVRYQTF